MIYKFVLYNENHTLAQCLFAALRIYINNACMRVE